MFGRFLPRETNFFDYFEKHASIILQAAEEFLSLVSSSSHAADKIRHIRDLEHQADQITHDCVEALHKTFITPIERDDIHRLISQMDDVIDYIEDAANSIAVYKLTEMKIGIKEMAEVLVRSAQNLELAVKGLRDLRNAGAVRQNCININHLENQADTILRNAIAHLFDEEKDVLMVIKWKEVYEEVEGGIDCTEDVSNIIDGIILEYV